MKIPTLIGLAILIALIGSFGFRFLYLRDTPTVNEFRVTDLQLINVSNTSATILWQTNSPAMGKVIYGESENLNLSASDNRDYKNQTPRLTHFVTLKNLKPNTKYFYKTENSGIVSKEKALEFNTSNLEKVDDLNFSFIKPLKGTILNTNLNPIDEALVFVEIPGAQTLATFSSTAGNFIMPLKLVLNKDLTQVFNIATDTQAVITVKKGNLQSKVQVVISDSTVNLPPFPIGAELDLSNYVKPAITKISISPTKESNFDFNGDGKINSLDLATLRGKTVTKSLLKPEDLERYDITSDGVVDQQDVDSFSRSLTGN